MSYCKPFKRGVSWRSQNFGDNATIYGPHSGNDDAAPIGTPVHAAGDGYVDWAGEFDDTYLDNLLWLLKMGGNILVLNCGANEPSFVYGHLNSFMVKRGDQVRKGQVIAYSGNTGTATTGAHLHTEAIPPGYSLNSPMLGRVNPDRYLTEWPEDINVGSLSLASTGTTTTPIQEDSLANFEEADIERIVKKAIDGWSKDYRTFAGNRNQLDTFAQTQAEHEAILAAINAIPASILFENRVDGRNIVDTGRQGLANDAVVLATLSGLSTGSTVTAADIAAAIPEDIAQQVVDALAARLVK